MILENRYAKLAFLIPVAGILAFSRDASAMPVSKNVASGGTAFGVTFWGEPFPYGYSWSVVRACARYLTVGGPRGPRVERVWVCNVPPRALPRRSKPISTLG